MRLKIPIRPTGKGDTTQGERSARREALLNVAAKRMGKETWSAVETAIREAVETAPTHSQTQSNLIYALESLLDGARFRLCTAIDDPPPADVLEALKAHPRRRKNWTAEEIIKREG